MYLAVLLLGPWAFDQLWVPDVLPTTLTLHLGLLILTKKPA